MLRRQGNHGRSIDIEAQQIVCVRVRARALVCVCVCVKERERARAREREREYSLGEADGDAPADGIVGAVLGGRAHVERCPWFENMCQPDLRTSHSTPCLCARSPAHGQPHASARGGCAPAA